MNIYYKVSAAFALLFFAVGAYAVPIEATYSVDANNGDGLLIETSDASPNPFIYNLMLGESQTFGLFNIYTNEGSVNLDDLVGRDIFVDFGFIQPEAGNAVVTGETDGRFRAIVFQQGRVQWDGPQLFSYGGDGLIEVALQDATFNTGLFGLDGGEANGATIFATLTLRNEATLADVPEPGVMALFALALIGMGFAARRQKNAPRI
ncbi:PEP-CTERM sorting domain-containing protein [Salinisphaera aquimarina]|uniref:PEP-CTERM sorting domain-containing protein n=1 Tax=Salinisphaera aquimarina TaxID=2094031 RepID=A0ABV7EU01_9GAMM